MKLSDVMKDSKIKIHASINGHGILLITKAVVGVRDGLLVESLTYFGDDMEFREPSKITAYNKRDGRTYEFEASSIGPVTTKYGHFHLIRCTQECKPSNRRKSERYEIDRLGVIRINKKPDIRNALVYDISMRGIAFILDSEAKCRLGDKITASFRYDPNYFHFYACEATVVRAFTIDSQVAIGCTIDSMGADLVTLISNRKKAKMGIDDKEILPISKSSDEDIASGKKIAVNYIPPIPQEELHKLQEPELLSPEDAADLIPEKNEREYIENRASRVADIDVVSVFANSAPSKEFLDELDSIEDRSPEYLKELNSIEDRTPKKAASKPVSKKDKAPAPKKEPAKPAPQKEKAPAVMPRQKSIADNLSLDNFDGFFNQKGNSVDEGLFAASRNDGFLTPEQIADIIELEHIHNG
ncbi:MAG: PilZ domain-containing protein [Butyrivibrio sp.]|nr:PilZ domain-containing protein [Butyrivibrio sp.]